MGRIDVLSLWLRFINILDFRKEELALAVDRAPPIGENQKIGRRGY